MKTGVNAIDSDDEEENAKQAKKTEYKKLNIDKVEGTEADPSANFDGMDDEGNMITGFNLKYVQSRFFLERFSFDFEGMKWRMVNLILPVNFISRKRSGKTKTNGWIQLTGKLSSKYS